MLGTYMHIHISYKDIEFSHLIVIYVFLKIRYGIFIIFLLMRKKLVFSIDSLLGETRGECYRHILILTINFSSVFTSWVDISPPTENVRHQ